MTVARTILIRLGLLIVALAFLIAAAVPFKASDDLGLSSRCGTTFFATEASSNIFLDATLRENCNDKRQTWRIVFFVLAGLGGVVLITGTSLPRPADPADPPAQRTEPAWKRDDEQP
jgi:hypothetical protein